MTASPRRRLPIEESKPELREPGYRDRTVVLSLALHEAVVPYVRADWDRARAVMLSNIEKLRMHSRGPLADDWLGEWGRAIERGPEAVVALCRLRTQHGDDLRQMTPLAGVLPYEVQRRIAKETPRAS